MSETKTRDELMKWARQLNVQETFDLSTNKSITGVDRRFAYSVAKKLQSGDALSFKQLKNLERVYNKVNDRKELSAEALQRYARQTSLEIDKKHLCLRMAWHDNRWNGLICLNPAANNYCVGEHSLLSARIRTRRNLDIESQPSCAGCKADSENLGDYQPPCFWSINAFGAESLVFHHDNPVAPDFPTIEQKLPPYSIISWPFKLSFTQGPDEKERYKNYYPKEIFENRIRIFQRDIEPQQSVVFTYCKFSNPISGEDMKYLVTGCALLADQGAPEYFNITADQLKAKAEQLKQPNFPKMNWGLRYTLDFEDTGVRLPYHEYLDLVRDSGITEEHLQEIAVTIDEPELREGFTYVAKHIDDDQAIFLLLKIRRSLATIAAHGFLQHFDAEEQKKRVEALIGHTWDKRGYLPGIKNLLSAIPSLKDHYRDRITALLLNLDVSDPDVVPMLVEALEGKGNHLAEQYDDILSEIQDFLQAQRLTAEEFLRLASLNLTPHQFSRIIGGSSATPQLRDVAQNPYLLFEDYEPGRILEDPLSGEKIDGPIDLFKIDIALMPLAIYQRRIPGFHAWKPTDIRRLRSVVIQVLRNRESAGDCYLNHAEVARDAETFSLFYRPEELLAVADKLAKPSEEVEAHFSEKLVLRRTNDVYYYLKELYDAETFVRQFISRLIERRPYAIEPDLLESDLPQAIKDLSRKLGQRFDEIRFRTEREHLYGNVLNKSFCVITGLPGAGKSYELLKIIDFLRQQAETHKALSLTGKAVLRLKNNEEKVTGVNALTIDKYLVDQENNRAQSATSVVHNLIIDEASMVDLPKFAEVLRSLEETHLKRLILVGDPSQLPPIGFGKPFVDIVEMMQASADEYADHGVELQINCRAEMSDEFIGFTRVFSNESKFAEGFLSQTETEACICEGALDLVHWRGRDELYAKLDSRIGQLLSDNGYKPDQLPAFFGITDASSVPADLERLQILSPYRSGFYGASGLNLHAQDALRADVRFESIGGDVVFKLHDKVMHTQNEYVKSELLVSNGSMGAVVSRRRVFFLGHDNPISIDKLRTRNMLELAYAITVHKSQGSGFNHVFIVLPEKAQFITRELLYTALTRARNKVTLFIQQDSDIPGPSKLLDRIRTRSAVLGRRTTLFSDIGQRYAYNPDEDVTVKSRVEYIIYRKLLEAKMDHGIFTFQYEQDYKVQGESFALHPDFVLHFNDGRIIYWEHLGRVTDRTYMNGWDKRRAIYERQGDFERVVTTDELSGINDEKIGAIVEMLVRGEYSSEDESNRYSHHHFSLR